MFSVAGTIIIWPNDPNNINNLNELVYKHDSCEKSEIVKRELLHSSLHIFGKVIFDICSS